MKKVAIALLGLLVAFSAWGQTAGTNTVSRGGYYFNATTGQKTDVDGNVYTNEASKDRDYKFSHTLFSRDTMAVGAFADSSAFYATGSARQMWLKLKAEIIGPGNAAAYARFAIEVRCAYTNPSAIDTFTVSLWNPSVTVGATAPATDSLAYTFGGRAPTSVASGSSEFVVTLANFEKASATTSGLTAFTSSAWVPLADSRGVFLWSPYTQVRVRVLGAPYNTIRLSAELVGRP